MPVKSLRESSLFVLVEQEVFALCE